MTLHGFLNMIGFSRHAANYSEQLISAAGGFLGIFGILVCSRWLLGPDIAVMIVPSMGASAVLLFAAPHAPFSQPWNVIGGHSVSAIIGIACWQWIPDFTVAVSASVGLAIGAMYFARCIHPPGGATALAAVIGSAQLHDLGYTYTFVPILLNAVIILVIAIAFNSLFHWRRYPSQLRVRKKVAKSDFPGYAPIKHEDFVYALSHIDTFVDITEEDLLAIYELATQRRVESSASP
jgi:CBS-domain-containing membrane protein